MQNNSIKRFNKSYFMTYQIFARNLQKKKIKIIHFQLFSLQNPNRGEQIVINNENMKIANYVGDHIVTLKIH